MTCDLPRSLQPKPQRNDIVPVHNFPPSFGVELITLYINSRSNDEELKVFFYCLNISLAPDLGV